MADLFGSTQAPRWLSIDERQELYQKLAIEATEGFRSGFQSAFNAAAERNSAMGKAQASSAQTKAEMDKLNLDETNKELEAQRNDAKGLIPYWAAPEDKRKGMTKPTPTSKWGLDYDMSRQQMQQQEELKKLQIEMMDQYRKNQLNIAQSRIDHSTEATKQNGMWESVYGRLSPETQAQIEDTFQTDGNDFRGGDGFFTPKARIAIANAAKTAGIPIGKFEETSAIEGQKQAGRETLEGQKQEGRKSLEEQKETGREKIQGMKGTEQEKIESMREKARAQIANAGRQLSLYKIQFTAKQNQLNNLMKNPLAAMDASEVKSPAMLKQKQALDKRIEALNGDLMGLSDKMSTAEVTSGMSPDELAAMPEHTEEADKAAATPAAASAATPAPAKGEPQAPAAGTAQPQHKDSVAVYDPKAGKFSATQNVPEYVQEYLGELYGASKGPVSKGAQDMLKDLLKGASPQELEQLAKTMGLEVMNWNPDDPKSKDKVFSAPDASGYRKGITREQAEKLLYDAVLKQGLPKPKQ